jgi:hypothetical protein
MATIVLEANDGALVQMEEDLAKRSPVLFDMVAKTEGATQRPIRLTAVEATELEAVKEWLTLSRAEQTYQPSIGFFRQYTTNLTKEERHFVEEKYARKYQLVQTAAFLHLERLRFAVLKRIAEDVESWASYRWIAPAHLRKTTNELLAGVLSDDDLYHICRFLTHNALATFNKGRVHAVIEANREKMVLPITKSVGVVQPVSFSEEGTYAIEVFQVTNFQDTFSKMTNYCASGLVFRAQRLDIQKYVDDGTAEQLREFFNDIMTFLECFEYIEILGIRFYLPADTEAAQQQPLMDLRQRTDIAGLVIDRFLFDSRPCLEQLRLVPSLVKAFHVSPKTVISVRVNGVMNSPFNKEIDIVWELFELKQRLAIQVVILNADHTDTFVAALREDSRIDSAKKDIGIIVTKMQNTPIVLLTLNDPSELWNA